MLNSLLVQQTAPSLSAPKPSMVQRLGSVPKGLKKVQFIDGNLNTKGRKN